MICPVAGETTVLFVPIRPSGTTITPGQCSRVTRANISIAALLTICGIGETLAMLFNPTLCIREDTLDHLSESNAE
jgi:hypothetical protein